LETELQLEKTLSVRYRFGFFFAAMLSDLLKINTLVGLQILYINIDNPKGSYCHNY
jgi:hypothetical protein